MERERSYFKSFPSSQVKEEVNWGPWLDMILSHKQRYTLWTKSAATPSAVMFFFMGHRITPLVSPWLTTTRRESKPAEEGRSVIRSHETCWKGWDTEE